MSCKCCAGVHLPFESARLPNNLTQTKAVVVLKPRTDGAIKFDNDRLSDYLTPTSELHDVDNKVEN